MSDRVVYTGAQDGVGRLALVGPDRRNAIDQRFVEELEAAVEAAHADAGLRALVVVAEGPAFTVGGDLGYIDARTDDLPGTLDAMISVFHRALGRYAALPVPVVVGAHGGAAGGGLGLLWPADVVLVGHDLKLATGFDRLGLSGDGGGSWWLPRLVGLRRAQELLIEGRVLDAATAVEWGIATRALGPDAVDAEAEDLARRLAAGPTVALGRIRRLLRESLDRDLPERLAEEHRSMLETGATPDAVEGIGAFAARRRPEFRGR